MIDDVGRLAEAFGEWLHAQTGRDSLVGELADRALLDARFPWSAAPEAIRDHLMGLGSDAG